MNVHHLELFYHVARHHGISRAVRHMPYGIQQPAVSSQILLLERDLGTPLFQRQPFHLTSAGRELYDFARPFFDRLEETGQRLRQQRTPRLRIAGTEVVLGEYLPPVLDELRSAYPELRFALRSGYQATMETWLQEGQIDVAITPLGTRPRAGLKKLPIVRLPMVLLVPVGSPLRAAKELWSRDVLDEELICLPATETVTQGFQRGLKAMKVEWPIAIEASSVGLIARYVANGYGIGVSLAVPSVLQHPQVRALPLSGFEPVEIAALWSSPASPAVTTFLTAVQRRAAELWPEENRQRNEGKRGHAPAEKRARPQAARLALPKGKQAP